jgi:16S rRNA (adenine1518-N6/adenine1519-N6)-dimethyltransferase
VTLYQEAREALQTLPFGFRKKLGQHFLVHQRVIDGILRLAELSSADDILEIGPGLGFMTRRLVEHARTVWAIEIDPFLVEWLKGSLLGQRSNFCLIQGDILEVDFNVVLPHHKVKLVGNLPYGISTPVLGRLLDERDRFSSLVLMVQKEVAQRMGAAPGSKSYGTLSILCQLHGKIVGNLSVSPEAFFPKPKVQSTVVKIGLYPEPLVPRETLPTVRALVRSAFGQRRKTLCNALAGWLTKRNEMDRFLRSHGINPQRRGETLSLHEFIRLAEALRAEGF